MAKQGDAAASRRDGRRGREAVTENSERTTRVAAFAYKGIPFSAAVVGDDRGGLARLRETRNGGGDVQCHSVSGVASPWPFSLWSAVGAGVCALPSSVLEREPNEIYRFQLVVRERRGGVTHGGASNLCLRSTNVPRVRREHPLRRGVIVTRPIKRRVHQRLDRYPRIRFFEFTRFSWIIGFPIQKRPRRVLSPAPLGIFGAHAAASRSTGTARICVRFTTPWPNYSSLAPVCRLTDQPLVQSWKNTNYPCHRECTF